MAHRGAAGARVGAAHGAGAVLPAAAPRPSRAHARLVRGLVAARLVREELREHLGGVPGCRLVYYSFIAKVATVLFTFGCRFVVVKAKALKVLTREQSFWQVRSPRKQSQKN